MNRDSRMKLEIKGWLDTNLPKIRTAVRLRVQYGEQVYLDFRNFLEFELFAARKKLGIWEEHIHMQPCQNSKEISKQVENLDEMCKAELAKHINRYIFALSANRNNEASL